MKNTFRNSSLSSLSSLSPDKLTSCRVGVVFSLSACLYRQTNKLHTHACCRLPGRIHTAEAVTNWNEHGERYMSAEQAAAIRERQRTALEVRLDAIHAGFWTAAQAGDPVAVAARLRTQERRAKLLGTTPPLRTPHGRYLKSSRLVDFCTRQAKKDV
jgi:hypothetical protein